MKELTGGHSDVVFKSKFTHDSKYLLSCGGDGAACLWDVNSNEQKKPLKCTYSGHLYPVWDISIYSQLNLFATSSKDGTSRLWSFDRLYPLRIYAGHNSDVNCVEFHPNGAYLATGSSDRTVRLWCVQTGSFLRLYSSPGHKSRIFSIAFSSDGNYLASGGEDRRIKIWDLRTASMLKELKGHSNIIHSLRFDNTSSILCSGGNDQTVKFWDININKSTGQNSENSSSSSSSSVELIESIHLDFNIYSSFIDAQNVAYITGAKKQESSSLLGTAQSKKSFNN
jgi:transcription initiation factor TFIID subunit 5